MTDPTSTTDADALFCPECGYDIRHTSQPRCPECGKPFNRAELSVSRIPWVHRKALGRAQAWWKTTWMLVRKPGDLAREVALPVDWQSASRYRWVTICIATAIAGLLATALFPILNLAEFRVEVRTLGNRGIPMWTYPWVVLLTGPGLITVVMLIVLAGTSAATFWVRTWFWLWGGARKEATSALSCYLSSHLCLPLILWTVARLLLEMNDVSKDTQILLQIFLWIAIVGASLIMLVWMLIVLYRTSHCGGMGVAVSAIALPLGSAVAAVLISAVAVYALGLAVIIAASLLRS